MKKLLRALPLILCAALLILYLLFGRGIGAGDILSLAPKSNIAASLFLLILYALKSLSLVFPIAVLEAAGGYLLPTKTMAVLVNTLGLIIALICPYMVGRFSGAGHIERLAAKYPKIGEIKSMQDKSPFFISFFLRVVAILPGDVVSMYLGASGVPFGYFLLGAMLGALPRTVSYTLVGATISEPSSPLFIISVALSIGLAAVSYFVHKIYVRKHRVECE